MPSSLLVAGLDARSLILEAPMLQRDRHFVQESLQRPRPLARDRAQRRASRRAGDGGCPTSRCRMPSAAYAAPRPPAQVSVLAILPAGTSAELAEETRRAGANAVLRRPLDRPTLEAALAKLLIVPRRVVARVPVSGQVVGSSRHAGGAHFCGLTHNLSVNGMLLASPLRLADGPDLDLEFVLPGVRARLRALGRVVREAPEVAWPFRGYGVEFLFVPEESHTTLTLVVSGALRPSPVIVGMPDPTHGIHSTVCREEWVYEIQRARGGRPGLGGGDPAGPARELASGRGRSVLPWWPRPRPPLPCARPGSSSAARSDAPARVGPPPVRDAEATLGECLASLAAQTLTDHEVVAVDDHATDGSRAILEEAARRDPRLRVLDNPGQGLVAALNAAGTAARAALLARMDADDVCHPGAASLAGRVLPGGPGPVRAGNVRPSRGESGPNEGMRAYVRWLNGLLDHEAIVRDLFVESPLAHPTVMMRAEMLARLGGYRASTGPEDYDLWLRAQTAGARFAKLPEVLLDWRDGPGRLSRTDPRYAPRVSRTSRSPRWKRERSRAGPPSCGVRVRWGRDGRGPCARAGTRSPPSSKSIRAGWDSASTAPRRARRSGGVHRGRSPSRRRGPARRPRGDPAPRRAPRPARGSDLIAVA